jgi:DNA-binding CsgD family transcriptional regulator
MDHLLVVASPNGIPEGILQSLRLAGWRITVTADIVSAKQLVQKGGVAGVMVDLKTDHDPERLKILRFVHEFCPNTMVIMLHSGVNSVTQIAGAKLVQTLDSIGDAHPVPQRSPSLDLYHLSPAQKRIAELVAQAYPNREIARKLKIKEQSVRNELSRIFRKMGIWNRVELALLLRQQEVAAPEHSAEPWKTQFEPVLAAAEARKPATV